MQTVVWTDDGVLLTEHIQQLIVSITFESLVSHVWCPSAMGVFIRLRWKSKSQSLSVAALCTEAKELGVTMSLYSGHMFVYLVSCRTHLTERDCRTLLGAGT